MNVALSYTLSLFMALLLHAGVVALLLINWSTSEVTFADIQPYYIEASIVAENPYTAEKEREADREKSKRDNKIRQRRMDEISFQKKLDEWKKEQARKKELEKIPLVVEPVKEEPPKKEEEKPDPDELRVEFEQGLALAIREEQGMRKAITDDEKAMAYVAQIQLEIIQNWSRPPSARNGMQSILRVFLIPTGEVVDVKVEESSGNDAFDRSAVLAVQKAERFVVPSDTLRFERDFREFTVLFRPEDLRL